MFEGLRFEFYLGLTGGIKHLEDHFTNMAEKGWLINKVGALFFRYEAVEPCKKRFYVDILPEIGVFDYPHNAKAQSYRESCEDLGWKYVTSQRGVHVFCADSGNNEPLELHTDHRVQNQIYMKAYRKTELISAIYSLIFLPFIYFSLASRGAELFLSDMMTFFLLATPILLIGVVSHILTGAIWYLLTWRAYKQGFPMPATPRRLYCAIQNIMVFGFLVFAVFVVVGIVLEVHGGVPVDLIILAFSTPLIGLIVGLSMRKQIDTKDRDREHNITNFILSLIGAVVFSAIFISIAIRFVQFPTWEDGAPGNMPAITLYSLGLPPPNEVIFRENSTSIAVPINYSHWELNNDGDMFTMVRQSVHSSIARRLFNNEIEANLDWEERTREHDFTYRRMDSREAALWQADEAVLFSRSTGEVTLILLQGRTMILLRTQGNIDVDVETLRQATGRLWLDLLVGHGNSSWVFN